MNNVLHELFSEKISDEAAYHIVNFSCVSGYGTKTLGLRPAACPRDLEIQLQSEIHGSRGQAAGRRRLNCTGTGYAGNNVPIIFWINPSPAWERDRAAVG